MIRDNKIIIYVGVKKHETDSYPLKKQGKISMGFLYERNTTLYRGSLLWTQYRNNFSYGSIISVITTIIIKKQMITIIY
jgi:hypothetical protein